MVNLKLLEECVGTNVFITSGDNTHAGKLGYDAQILAYTIGEGEGKQVLCSMPNAQYLRVAEGRIVGKSSLNLAGRSAA